MGNKHTNYPLYPMMESECSLPLQLRETQQDKETAKDTERPILFTLALSSVNDKIVQEPVDFESSINTYLMLYLELIRKDYE